MIKMIAYVENIKVTCVTIRSNSNIVNTTYFKILQERVLNVLK